MADIEELLRVCSDDESLTRSCCSPGPASGQGGGKSGPPPLGLSIAVDGQGGAFDRTPFLRQSSSPCPDPPPSSQDSQLQLSALHAQVATLAASVAAQDERLERMVRLNAEQMGLLLKIVGAKNGAPTVPPLAPEPDTGFSMASNAVAPPPCLPATGGFVTAVVADAVAPATGLPPAAKVVDPADTALVNTASSPPDTGDSILGEMFPDAVVAGPDLPPRLASVISRHWTTAITKDDYDAMGELPLPRNLTAIQTAMVNDVIWEKLPHDVKSADNRVRNQQNNLQKAALFNTATVQYFLEKEKEIRAGKAPPDPLVGTLLKQCMNSFSLLGSVSDHLTTVRRNRIRPFLKNKELCSLDLPPSDLLFGDLKESLVAAEQKAKLTDTVTAPSSSGFRHGPRKSKPPPKIREEPRRGKATRHHPYHDHKAAPSNPPSKGKSFRRWRK